MASGPFPPGPGLPGSDAIPADSPRFVAWASGIASFNAGSRQAGLTVETVAYGVPGSALGPPDAAGSGYDMPATAAPVLSLGDGGSVTLTFTRPVSDGDGADFAVFENGFSLGGSAAFAELAFVEVSSDGLTFVRFPAVSFTPVDFQAGLFGTLDPTDLHNFAGKFPAGFGTPFDLAELAGSPGLDITRVTHVRIIDVTGDVSGGYGSKDSLGHWINDPFPTNFQTGGFDLDAVGVIHSAGESWSEWIAGAFGPEAADEAIAGPVADPDRDGRPNLVEWAAGSSPAVPDAEPALTIESVPEGIRLRHHRRSDRPGVSLVLQQSADGIDWREIQPGETIMTAESGSPLTEVTIVVPASGRRQFRLAATGVSGLR